MPSGASQLGCKPSSNPKALAGTLLEKYPCLLTDHIRESDVQAHARERRGDDFYFTRACIDRTTVPSVVLRRKRSM
jgi:hypothetical protein